MPQKHTLLLAHSPLETPLEREKGTDLRELASSTSFSIEKILNQRGEINFDMLIQCFRKNHTSVYDFFKKKEHIEGILFPFFDFLRHTYFSKNKTIPQDIVDILEDNSSVRNGVLSYIEERNSQ